MSKKDYKKGMSDAVGAYEDFGKKQETAIEHVASEVEKAAQKVDKLGDKIGEFKAYITDQEKVALYKLNTPVDIAALENSEKRILLAVLYQLSADEAELTEPQQGYVRAAQQYLKIFNPQTKIDLEAVENIEDISSQKAILQSVLEFFYLGAHPGSYTEDQMEFLDYFQVNRKTRREISDHIKAIVDAVGMEGLAEKYGFAAQQPASEFAAYTDNGEVPGTVADALIAMGETVRFDGGLYFLDTLNYFVFCKDVNCEDEDTEKCNRLFRMDKRTGKVDMLPVDYEKYLQLEYAFDLSYHIQDNMLYVIEDRVNCSNTGREFVQPIAIDVENLTYRALPIKFSGRGHFNRTPRFHLSGDNKHLAIYAYEEGSYRKPSLSQIHVVDLAQDRVFLIEPDMVVRDALWWDGSLRILGEKGDEVSLFQYDISTRTLCNMFPGCEYAINSMFDLYYSSRWVDAYEKMFIIKRLNYIQGKYYLQIKKRESYSGWEHACFYLDLDRTDDDGKKDPWAISIYSWKDSMEPFYRNDKYIFSFHDHILWAYDFNGELKVADKSAGSYNLIGDYLYKHSSSGWYKTNIAEGIDNLQWEVFNITD